MVVLAFAVTICMGMSSVPPQDSWSASGTLSGAAQEEAVLRIGLLQQVDDINPNVGLTDTAHLFYSLVYDSLITMGNDLEAVGNLATSWWVVPEDDPELVASGEPYGSVWEYNISQNAKWHDGEWFTVEDVVWNVNLHSENYEYIWPYQSYAYFIDYAEPVDGDTVRIHYSDRETGEPMPVAYGDSLVIRMLPRHLLSEYGVGDISFTWNGVFSEDESPGYPIVGTGPFTGTPDFWEDYTEGRDLTLVRNPDYHWAADWGLEVRIDKIVLKYFENETDLSSALLAGEVDIAELPGTTYEEIKAAVISGDLTDIETFDGLSPDQGWTDVAINMNPDGPNKARLDPAVRRAMAMATNKTYITETLYQGYAEPGSTLISPVVDWHLELTPDESFPFDLDMAAEELEDAGYVYTNESPDVRVVTEDSLAYEQGWASLGDALTFDILIFDDDPLDMEMAQALADMWAEVGMDLVPRLMVDYWPTDPYSYDLELSHWRVDPDPNSILFCQSSYAWYGWSDNTYYNASFEANYTASVNSLDRETRKTHVDNCQRIHYRDVGYIVLAYIHQTYAWRTDTFTGWGDWAEDPGRSLDARWGANPLLFDLVAETSDVQLVPYGREGSFSMLVPEGWTLEEDVAILDRTYDLVIKGPVHDNSQTNIIVEHESAKGVEETREYLESEMNKTLDGLEEQGTSTTMILSPVYWEGTNYSALRFAYEWDSTPLAQDLTIYADAESSKVWAIICTVHSDFYEGYAAVFEEIAESLEVVESDPMSTLEIVAMVAAAALVIAVVAVAAYLVLSNRKKSEAPPPPPAA